MSFALKEAETAASLGEVPVGAVVVCGGKIISAAFNSRETDKNALCHAELKAISKACEKLGGWRLFMCDIYVTLEPCQMCAGAIINARLRRVVFGACEPRAGAVISHGELFSRSLDYMPEVTSGVLDSRCSALLSDFFVSLRRKRNKSGKTT